MSKNSDGSKTKAVKFDNEKPRFDLIPSDVLEEVAKVFTFGMKKYGTRNWEKGDIEYGRYFSAAQRHLWVWLRGEEVDSETGISHLSHAICSIMMLRAIQMRGIGIDDR